MKRISYISITLLCIILLLCGLRRRDYSVINISLNRQIKIKFGGQGFYPVEMDGYGIAHKSDWPVDPGLPYVSPSIPNYYLLKGSPVAYKRGSKPRITINTQTDTKINGYGIIIGESEHLNFQKEIKLKEGIISTQITTEKKLPNYIDKWENEIIKWKLKYNNSLIKLGSTANSIYVILNKPLKPLLHTPLNIATTAAQGLTDTSKVIDSVWNRFKNKEIYRVRDKKPLRYYGYYENRAPAELRRLLISGTGQCVAWSYLLYATLGSQGIESKITLIVPPQKGRLFVKNWKFIKGHRFILSGKNGVAETTAQGDDIQIIERGNGRPFSQIWKTDITSKNPIFSRDDSNGYSVGTNGIVDTKISLQNAVPTLPFKFGLANQRAFIIKAMENMDKIQLKGDDIIAKQLDTYYIFTGINGILETPWQKEFKKRDKNDHRSSNMSVGSGYTKINFSFAIPQYNKLLKVKGDDQNRSWRIGSGENGVSDTPDANYGQGDSFSAEIKAGPNGVIDSKPSGDDIIIDLHKYIANAPRGYEYIQLFNMWPMPGVSGQDNSTPPPDYPNHEIVQVGDEYYDPSYGTGPFKSQLEWEKASLEGVGIRKKNKKGDFLKFNGKMIFLVKPVKGDTTLTSFITTLPPI